MTGLVYLAIIALWAVFLVPWVSRHREEQHDKRSADRYLRAMDTLAKANHSHEEFRREQAPAHDDAAEDASATPSMAWNLVADPFNRTGGRSAAVAKRRRRVLAILAAGLLGSLAAAISGIIHGAVAGVFIGLMVVYLTALSRGSVRASGNRRSVSLRRSDADWYREATRRAQQQARGLLSSQTGRDQPKGQTWDARPTTLPTYVSKSRASKVPRVVDLKSHGRPWGEAMVQQAQEERRRAQEVQFEREMSVIQPDPSVEVAELANPEPWRAGRHQYRRAVNE